MEASGQSSVLAESVSAEENPLEAIVGTRWASESGVNLSAGFGLGIVSGFGAPDWRGIFGIEFARARCSDCDGDTIPNALDSCPDHAEDFDGFEDEDGCPDPDDDGDGILDEDDGCPTQAEDFDGFEDEDGCPDPDNDGDGLADEDDACPNEREDFDGFEDEDGCPEEGEGLVVLTCAQIEIRERVEFATDSAEIDSVSHGLLDQVAQVLRTAGYIRRVRVEGHTDSRGDAAYNLDLSQRRADAVRAYLLRAGVTQEVDALGLGEELPISDNETRDGRQNNRRVEFHVVEQDATCVE